MLAKLEGFPMELVIGCIIKKMLLIAVIVMDGVIKYESNDFLRILYLYIS